MKHILLVEDDHQLRRSMQIVLRAHAIETDAVRDGREALSLEALRPVDLVVLDLGLPDLDGLEVLRRLRVWTDVPVLVVTARQTEGDRRAATAAGADAFLAKPFEVSHLVGMVQELLAAAPPAADRVLELSGTTVDFTRRRATRGDHELRMSPVDWRLLEVFARSDGRTVTTDQLLPAVAGGRSERLHPCVVEVAVRRLCHALDPDPSHPACIDAGPGGFRLAG